MDRDLRVLIVANDPLARAGLATLLAAEPGCSVAGQVSAADDLLHAAQVYRPDAVLWDLGMASAASVELIEGNHDLGAPIVALVPDDVDSAGVWAAGARGILLREASVEHIVAALQAVAEGLAVVDLTLAAALVPTRAHQPAVSVEPLTPREIEVLRLMAEGHQNKEIARLLGISEHTVKFHVNAILGKLSVQSRTEAVVRATRLGLILL